MPKFGNKEVPESVQKDVSWWIEFAPRYNRVSLITQPNWSQVNAILSSDSCLTGGGAFFEGKFVHWTYPAEILRKKFNINQLEYLMITVALKLWYEDLKTQKIKFYCDNLTSVYGINSGAIRDQVIQTCLREIHMLTALGSFKVRTEFLEGVENRIFDALSRWHLSSQFQEIFLEEMKEYQLEQYEVNRVLYEFIL